jgi:hypothetical protein
MNVCLFVCLYEIYKFTFLSQTLLTSPPWSGRDRRVCIDPRILTSSTFWVLFLRDPLQNHGHRMADGATVFRDTLISVIPACVRVTSPTLRCRRSRNHPRQPYIRDCSGSSSNVAEMTSQQTSESSATASYPLFRRVFASRHGYYVQPGDGAIRQSVISLILAPVSVTYGKSRPCRRQLRIPAAYCTVGNAYDTLGLERDPCVYNSEPHQTGRK